MRTASSLIAVVATLLLSGSAALASAQSPPDAEPLPKIEGSADLSFTKATGNAPTETLGLSGMVTIRPGAFRIEAHGGGVRSSDQTGLHAENLSLTTRLSRDVTPKVALFAQHDYMHDPFSGLGDGHFLTGGVSFKFLDNDEHQFKVDASAGRNNQTGYSSRPGAGAIFGVTYRWAFSSNSELTQDTRWLISFTVKDARRLENTTALTVGMTSILSLRLSYALRHQNAPRARYKQTDTTTSTALVFSF